MISPSNTFNGLTIERPGTTPASRRSTTRRGARTYFRLLPNDHVQAAALATAMRDRGCKRLAVVHDGEVYGRGMDATSRRPPRGSVCRSSQPPHQPQRPQLPLRSRRAKRRLRRLHRHHRQRRRAAVPRRRPRACPRRSCSRSDGVAESGFTGRAPGLGRAPHDHHRRHARARRLPAARPDRQLPTRTSLRLRGDEADPRRHQRRRRRQGGRCSATCAGVQNRASALGTYGFDANGDTTLRTYGLYTIRGRPLRWAGPVTAA